MIQKKKTKKKKNMKKKKKQMNMKKKNNNNKVIIFKKNNQINILRVLGSNQMMILLKIIKIKFAKWKNERNNLLKFINNLNLKGNSVRMI